MAELRFDITGNTSGAQRAARDLAGATDVAARGARLLADSLDKQRRASAASVGATVTLAKADKILADAEHALADGALEAEFALKRETSAAQKSGDAAARAAVENRTLASSLKKIGDSSFLQPSFGGTLLGLLPTLIPIAGQVAAAAGAISVSFGAAAAGVGLFGLTATSVLSHATQDLAKLQALQLKLNTATTAKQKKAAEQQISALKATWGKGYLDLISNYQTFQDKWKKISQQIAVPTLNVWLPVLTKGLQFLKPLIKPIADAFTLWGITLNTYFSNPATAQHIKDMAGAFGNFAAQQLFRIGQFIKDIGEGVFNLGRDLAASGANFNAFGPWLSGIGDAFLSWSKSKQARADVQGFMKFIHDEGPVVTGILKDLGKLLPGVFAGATTAGTLELQALGDFLNLVAKLPKDWQKGITEAAGALLLLSKLGVIKIGIKLVGAAVNLLSGGTVKLGGATAAAEMEAAMRTGGAQAAAEIRAAMAGGKAGAAAGGAAGAAGTGESVGAVGALLGGGLAAAAAAAVAAAGHIHSLTGKGSVLRADLQGLIDANHQVAASASKDWGALVASAQNDFGAVSGSIGTDVHDIAKFWGTLVSDAKATFNTVLGSARAFGHAMASSFDALRHDIATIWDTIWVNTVGRARSGIDTVIALFRTLPGRAISALTGLGHSLGAFASAAMNEMWNGFRRVAGSILKWLGGFVSSIISKVKSLLHIGSPSAVFHDIGMNMMLGLERGIKAGAHHAANAARSAAQGAVTASGARTRSAAVAQSFAASILPRGWSMADLIKLWNQESGWNAYAVNPSSGAYGIPQSLGHGHPYNLGDYKAQIEWGINYIAGRYGNSQRAWAHEVSSGWYDHGGWLPPGLSLALNTTGRPEQVISGRGGTAPTVVINVNVPPTAHPQETARLVGEAVRRYTKGGGQLYPAGVAPR